MEVLGVAGNEHSHPWSSSSSRRVLGQRRKGEGMRTDGNERGDHGGRLVIFKTEND